MGKLLQAFYDQDGQRAVCAKMGRPDLLKFAWGRTQPRFASSWTIIVADELALILMAWIFLQGR